MSGNDENRKPSNHGTPSINTAFGSTKHREGDSSSMSATTPSNSQGSSLQSPRAGAQATPSLPTIQETVGSTSPTSPQYTLSQSGNNQGDITPSSSEQHDTASQGTQDTSILSAVMGALRLSRTLSPPTEDVTQHELSPTGTDQDNIIPPASDRQEASASDAQHTSPLDDIREASDRSESSRSSYPSPQDDPQHALSLNGVDESDFAPSFPLRQFEYSTVPADLHNIRQQDMNQYQGDSSVQPAGDSAPPVPPRAGHIRQRSVDERSDSSVLPHERVDGGIGSSTRFSSSPPARTAVFGAPSAASSYPDRSLREMLHDGPPTILNGSAIEDSPPSSRDGPSTHTASTAESSFTTNGHITIHSPQRDALSPLTTTNLYASGRQSEMTPFPPFVDRMSPSDEESSSGAETSSRTHDRIDVPNTASVPPRGDTPNPSSIVGAPSSSAENYSTFSPISPGSQPQIRQEVNRRPSISWADTLQDRLRFRNDDFNVSPPNATEEVVHIDEEAHGKLTQARTEPRVSSHEIPSSIRRRTKSADHKEVRLDPEAQRKAKLDEWMEEVMPKKKKLRENTSGEAYGGKRKGSDVGMHKPLVKAAKKYAEKIRESWLDTTTGKKYDQRQAAKAVQKARRISQEVHGNPVAKSRLASVTEIAKSPTKSFRRMSTSASRLFSRAEWERSADDQPTNHSASPAGADVGQQRERRRFSSFTGSMRGSISNLTNRMKPNFRRSRSEANVLGPTEANTMDVWRASREVNRPQRTEQTEATPNLDVQIDSSRLVSPTTTRTTPFDVHPGCLTGSLTIDGEARCTHCRTVPIARTESERRNDPENVPTMVEAVPVLTPDNGSSDESETSSQVEARSPSHSASK